MIRGLCLIAAAALLWALLWALPAHANLAMAPTAAPGGTCGISSGYVGPIDCATHEGYTVTACYSMLACSHAIAIAGTQPLVNLNRTSDSHTCDALPATNGSFGVTGNCSTGGDDGEAVSTWCTAASGSCSTANERYDQTGNGHNQFASGDGQTNTIGFALSCINSQPCLLVSTTGAFMGTSGTFTPATGVEFFDSVAQRQISSSAQSSLTIGIFPYSFASFDSVMGFNGAVNQVLLYDGAADITATAADATTHVLQGIVNGSSSCLYIDGASCISGSLTDHTTAEPIISVGLTATGSNLFSGEDMLIDNPSPTNIPALAALLHTLQSLHWGTP